MRSLPRIALLLLPLLAAACGGGEPVPSASPDPTEYEYGLFTVTGVTAQAGVTLPAEVSLLVEGEFPDGCTEIADVTQEREELQIRITIETRRPAGAACTAAIVPHTETVRLGLFDQGGTYAAQVNDHWTLFDVGPAPTEPVPSYTGELTLSLETPDGALQLTAPADWASEVLPGVIRLASDGSGLVAEGFPSVPRLEAMLVTGPSRFQDFGLDGATLAEVYATFSMASEIRVGAPDSIDLPWTGLMGHRSLPAGERELRAYAVADGIYLIVDAACPPGDWEQFEPLFQAILATLRVE